jgi:penicillin-binding protein 1A
LRVYTSLDTDLQKAANQAVLDGLAAYERRHGWNGNLQNVLKSGGSLASYENPGWQQPLQLGTYQHALVTALSPKSVTVKIGRYNAASTSGDIAWTHHRLSRVLKVGDVAYVKVLSLSPEGKAHVSLEQDSGVQGALVAIDNATGDIKAMVGGRDFDASKFNRATQAYRQVGSSFKPFVYTAAIDQGATPDDVIVDEPTSFVTTSGPYAPHNFDEKFEGSITLRRALAQSRNVPAVKMAEHLGIKTVVDYARRFGITSPIPAYLPVALGSADLTLMEQTSAYSVFPDDGIRLVPRSIVKVTDYDGRVLEENFPETKDVISSRTARTVTSMLREVVLHGTAVAATQLNFPVAGKTGTTNNFTDAWFVGFSPSITCGVWVGFDEKKTLGSRETGALAALPIWMNFMKAALAGRESRDFPAPPFVPPNAIAQKLDTPDFAPPGDESH